MYWELFLQESVDKCEVLQWFYPPRSVITVEASLNASIVSKNHSLPHGNVDLLVVSLGDYSSSSIGVLVVDDDINYVRVAASMKTEHTLRASQSRKYACCRSMAVL